MYLQELYESDSGIHSNEYLDSILADLCRLVIAGQQADHRRWGMVAACIVDHKKQKSWGLNYFDEKVNDLRIHAERAALDTYYNIFGSKPMHNSVIVTTCSPCNLPHMQDRYGQSCSDLIRESGVKNVYAGFHDPSQLDDHSGFDLKISQNPKILKLCEKFARTFI